jgi:hypothetical protein
MGGGGGPPMMGGKPPMMGKGGKGMPIPLMAKGGGNPPMKMPMGGKGGAKPPGFAFGTRDVPPAPISPVPAPGQTITSGSWTGPQTPPPPQPMGGGQNSNLRSKIKAMGYASGTPDVSDPNMGAAGGQPTPGYDAQTGSYPVDEHFVAHLRAAMGMGPKGATPGYAGGSPNVGAAPLPLQFPRPAPGTDVNANASQPSAPMQPQSPPQGVNTAMRNAPGFLEQMSGGPVTLDDGPTMQPSGNGFGARLGSATALMNGGQAPAPTQAQPQAQPGAQPQAQPGASAQGDTRPAWLQQITTPPTSGEKITGMLFGGQQDLRAREATANFYSDPNIQRLLTANPDMAAHVQRDPQGAVPMMAQWLNATNAQGAGQITHAMPNGTVIQKIPDDSNKISVVSAGMGVDPKHAHLMMEPHQYSDDEWINAAASMPIGTAQKLWGMQHYLKPQETAAPAYMGLIQKQIADGNAALQAATKGGDRGAIAKAQADIDKANQKQEEFLRAWGLGQATPYATMGGTQ